MRIVFFADNFYPEISGISDSILITGRELLRRGHGVMYVAPRYSESDYKLVFREDPTCPPDSTAMECIHRIPIVRLPSVPLPLSPTKQSRIAFPFGASFSSLEKFKPDILHTNSPYGCGLEALRAARRFHVPLVGTNHTPVAEFYPWAPNFARRLDARYYNHCAFISAPYSALISDMREKGFRKEGEAVPNPVELPRFTPATREEKAALKKKLGFAGPVMLYAGRLAKEKRIDVIVRGVATLVAEFPSLTFVSTGHGAEAETLLALARELGIERNVRFTGFIRIDDLIPYYRVADLFAIMSTADSQSVSLMQAFAVGIPAVGARARGLPDYLPPDCGFLVEPGDVGGFAARAGELLRNPEVSERMGRAGQAFVKQFSPSAIAERWEAIYEKHQQLALNRR